MEKHYQIVDGDIVFRVSDTDAVLSEIRQMLESRFPMVCPDGSCDGGDPTEFEVEFGEDPLEDGNVAMCLSISSSALDAVINFTAEKPVLLNVDGKFGHWWDMEFSSSSRTRIYSSEDMDPDEEEMYLEDEILASL